MGEKYIRVKREKNGDLSYVKADGLEVHFYRTARLR